MARPILATLVLLVACSREIAPPRKLEYLRLHGSPQAPVLLEAHAEGLIRDLDVRKPPGN